MKMPFRLLVIFSTLIFWACSDDEPDILPEVGCLVSTLAVTAQSDGQAGCLTTDGKITAAGTGGEGTLMYSIGSGAFQSSPEFTDLSPGVYTINVTDETECVKTAEVQIISGISYEAQIRPIIESSCAISDCHDGSSSLPDFTVFANFQSRAEQAKSRTGSGDMPRSGSLTADEVAMIACWVDDGALAN